MSNIREQLERANTRWSYVFHSDAPDVEDDPEFAIEWLFHAMDLGYEPEEYEKRATAACASMLERGETLPTRAVEELTEILDAAASATRERRREAIYNEVLDVTASITLTVKLSVGGPGSKLTAEVNVADRSVTDVRFHYSNGFQMENTSVNEGDPLWRLAEWYAEIVEFPKKEEDE